MLVRYRRGAKAHRRPPRRKSRCWRETWSRNPRECEARNGDPSGHIHAKRGGWLIQYYNYCNQGNVQHDPLRWHGSELLSPQRHNGMPLLVGFFENERDSPESPYEWEIG